MLSISRSITVSIGSNTPLVRPNLLTKTEQFDNAAWLGLNSGTASLPVVTANFGTAPDGTATADRVQFDRGAGTTSGDISRLFQDYVDPASGVGTNSCFVRSTDGVSSFTLTFQNGIDQTVVTVTGAWQRFPNSSTGTTVNFQVGLWGDRNQQTADVLLWGAKGEHGPNMTPYQRVD